MKFELYHHFYMILMENEEITADIKHSVKYWWTKPKSQSEEVLLLSFLGTDKWSMIFLKCFFFPSF